MKEEKQLSTGNPLKALDILEALSQTTKSVGISELSIITGMSKSTLHRILTALIERNYVSKDPSTKQYSLGFKVLDLSANLLDSLEIRNIVRREMRELALLTGETVHLICLDGDEGLYIDKIDTTQSVGLLSRVGKRLPLYCTGGGKSLLSHQTPDWIEDYLAQTNLKKFTPQTMVEHDEICRELETIKREGYALDREEHHANINCIAVPLLNSKFHAIASISIAAPAYRFSIEDALKYKDILLETAANIHNMLL